ncbi:NADPH--cytochrome P450 reductase [Thraustotheca clavata]|uniref:NADPH--hemoprotein reductase n=1 Tax=Thraustotheca clavata TaxID=74557 RepID=A0A1V9Z5K2_9STRA|nr:NADPH--cytochrome P450 reductase [Thraustotheca clavata]
MPLLGWFQSCLGAKSKVGTISSSITVFYGSETGTTKGFAQRLRQKAAAHNIQINVKGLESFNPENLSSYGRLVFMTASYGTGGPTTNAENFHKWLSSTIMSLTSIEYTVFAVGSSIYSDSYNGMGKFVDSQLAKLGAKRFYKLGLGDTFNDLEQDFMAWEEGLWAALTSDVAPVQLIPECPFKLVETNELKSYKTISPLDNNLLFQPPTLEMIHLVFNATASCMFGTIQFLNSQTTYRGTDHLVLYPCNPSAVVNALSKRCGASLDQIMITTATESMIPLPSSVHDILTYYYDCQTISHSLLTSLSMFASDKEEQSKLMHLGSFDGTEDYRKLPHYTLLGLLEQFTSITIDIPQLISLLPIMPQRTYTIASHTLNHCMDLCISVQQPSQDLSLHKGLMAMYLHSLNPINPDTRVKMRGYVKPSEFTFKDPKIPIIMIAAGSGIAPMRALWQERNNCGQMLLFFGCKSKGACIYADEIEQSQIITYFAYSQDSQPKEYETPSNGSKRY